MSVSIPGWWWPGGAAGRAVTQIRARCGGRGGAARSCAQPGHQLASCAGVCPNNLIPAATFTFHLYPRTRTFSNFRASAQCYPRLELPLHPAMALKLICLHREASRNARDKSNTY